ncbi:MAG: hypothetical protein Tsb0013_08850 [Phycisphaerales bacterium]
MPRTDPPSRAAQGERPPVDWRALTSRIASGDEAAFVPFHERWRPYVRRLAQQSFDADHADDIAQEVFMRVIRKMPVLDTEAGVASWLTTTTRRCAVDAMRAQRRARRHDALDRTNATDSADRDLERAMTLLEQSEDELRTLIEARVRFGWTFERIGRAFGLTPSAVDGRIKRATRRMRELMNEGDAT